MSYLYLIQDEIDRMSLIELQEKYNVSEWTVRESIRKLGLKKKRSISKPSVNRDFFKELNHKSAYVFGYFLGDGSYNKYLNHGRVRYRMQIVSSERCNIEMIRNAMQSKHKITEKVNKSRELAGRVVKESVGYYLCISDERFIKNLQNLGVQEDKTNNGLKEYPAISEDIAPDIARGLLDSDGCINITPQGSLNLVWVFSEETMLNWFKEFIFVPYSIKTQVTSCGHKLYKLCVWKQTDIEKLYRWMYYPGVELYSNRKKSIFEVKIK